jgi:hypothetical protein
MVRDFWHLSSKQRLTTVVASILKEVDTTVHTVQFNGSLLKENVFRQEAGPEVDAAWASLGVNCEFPYCPPKFAIPNSHDLIDRSLAVSANEAAKSGLKPDQVQISKKYGGGFPANVEGLRHLRCLVYQSSQR